ncbi:MAG TPA: hypothetical protein VFO25_07440 [Candidatus Eremiobacteraceae bacterium]|nr:hypothetical protein [Candidatus Eremiobacteraceae bacterium]
MIERVGYERPKLGDPELAKAQDLADSHLGEPDRQSLATIVADPRRDVPANRRIPKAVRKIRDAV